MKYAFENFYGMITSQAKERGRKTALFVGEEAINYKTLHQRVDTFAAYLAHQEVRAGDRVALLMRNSAEFVYSVLAINKIGAVVVPINTFLTAKEVSYILQDSGARLLIASTVHEAVAKDKAVQQHLRLTIWEGESSDYNTRHVPFDRAMTFPEQVAHHPMGEEDLAVINLSSTGYHSHSFTRFFVGKVKFLRD